MPTLVAMHHLPFDLGIKPIDAHPLRGRKELAAIVAAHPQVVRIVGGHVHIARERDFGGTIASTAPSTSHQLVPVHVGTRLRRAVGAASLHAPPLDRPPHRHDDGPQR